MRKVHIIIPHYNRYDLLHARLSELFKHEKDNIESVLVVDNGSTDELTDGGMKWWAEFQVRYGFKVLGIRTEENIGFLKASNLGLRYDGFGAEDILILLSNDVVVSGKFIEQIVEIIETTLRPLVGGVVYLGSTGWNVFGGVIYPYAEGWLLATTKRNWEELGYFDEIYAPHIFEDVDLSTKAISLGYSVIPLNNNNLHHLTGQTIKYNSERDELTKTNQQKFGEKWKK